MDLRQEPHSNPPPAAAPGKICPYLGKYNDADTCYGYPDLRNRCHHANPPQHILLDYQVNVCQAGAGAYQDCPVYPQGWKEPFPQEINGIQAPRRRWNLWLGILFAILVMIILLYVFLFRRSNSGAPVGETPTPVAVFILASTFTPSSQQAISTSTLTSTTLPPTITPALLPSTATSTQSSTAAPVTSPTPGSPTPGPLEETPFGPGGLYLVHISKESDTLESIARVYNTTIEVLRAINMAPQQPSLWAGVPIVVIIGEKDITKITPLKAVWLADRTLVFDLQQKYTMTDEEFRTINALGEGTWVEAGRWLIVTR